MCGWAGQLSFSHKLSIQLSDPLLKQCTVHPTLLLRSVSAGKVSDASKTSWSCRFTNDEHWQLLANCICSRHTSKPCFAVLTTHTFLTLQMQSLIGKSLMKQAKFICVENIFKLVVGDYGWESCLIPRSGHFRRAQFCFSSNRLKPDTVPWFQQSSQPSEPLKFSI